MNKFNSRSTVASEVLAPGKINAILTEGGEIGIVLPKEPVKIRIDNKDFTGSWEYKNQLLVIECESQKEVLVQVHF